MKRPTRRFTAPTSRSSDGQRFWLVADRPSKSGVVVARALGSRRSPVPRLTRAVGLALARGHEPARAVVLERPPNHHAVVGEERGCEGVAREPGHGAAVEGEAEGARAVEEAAAAGEARAHVGTSVPSVTLGSKPQPGRSALMDSRRSSEGPAALAG
jgi:hypothetical protein